MSLPELACGELTLRKLKLEDADGNYPQWLNDPVVTKYNSHGEKEYTKTMAIAYINSVQDSPINRVFAIIYAGQHIGNISLQNIDKKNSSAEFAILIGEPSVYSKGIGYMAGSLLVEYGFSKLHLQRIYCGTSEKNIGMQKLALKLGMKKVGQRSNALYKRGKHLSVYEYEVLKVDT